MVAAENSIKMLYWGDEWHFELHIFGCCSLFSKIAFLYVIYPLLLLSLTVLYEQADLSQAGHAFILGLGLILLHLLSQEHDLVTSIYAAQWSCGMAVGVIHFLMDNYFKWGWGLLG